MAELTDDLKAEILDLIKENLKVEVTVDNFGMYTQNVRVRVTLGLIGGDGIVQEFSTDTDSISISGTDVFQ